MARKSLPEFRINCYKAEAIPKISGQAFVVNDIIEGLLQLHGGESSGTYEADAIDTGNEWQNQEEFLSISKNLAFIHCQAPKGHASEGTAGASSGPDKGVGFFYLRGREDFKNCTLGTPGPTVPEGNSQFPTMEWEQTKPNPATTPIAEVYLPDAKPSRTRIGILRQFPDQPVEVRTKLKLRQNQQLRADISFFGLCAKATKPGALRLMIEDGKKSLVWRQNAPPVLEKMTPTGWANWRTLSDAPNSDFKNDVTVRWRRLGKRLLLSLTYQDGKFQYDVGEVRSTAIATAAQPHYEPVEVKWGKGRIAVRAFNVLATVGIALINYRQPDTENDAGETVPGAPFTGDFEREQLRPANAVFDLSGGSPAVDGFTGGYNSFGTSTAVAAQLLPATSSAQARVRYSCTLKADPDGIDSPAVSVVCASYLGAVAGADVPPLDIAPAFLSGRYSSAEPPLMHGAMFSAEVSRNALKNLGAALGVDWELYVKQFNPIELSIRWRYEDGSYSNWCGKFKGSISEPVMDVKQHGLWNMSLTCQDAVLRLHEPAGIVDHNFGPLDFLFASGGGTSLYGPQAIQHLLRIAAGDAFADSLNGNGDALRYVGAGFPALISMNTDRLGFFPLAHPFSSNGWQLPAPYGSDVLSWITSLTRIDHTQFFIGYPGGSGLDVGSGVVWASPVVARIPVYLASRPTWIIPDADYAGDDVNLIMMSAQTRLQPAKQINRVLAWGKTPGQPNQLPMPAVFSGEARLPTSDPNAQEHSWPRTLVLQNEWLYLLGFNGLAALASLTMDEFEGRIIQDPSLTFRGEAQIGWGDILQPKMVNVGTNGNFSDPHINLDGKRFRVVRIDEDYQPKQLGPRAYTTTAAVFPLSATGL